MGWVAAVILSLLTVGTVLLGVAILNPDRIYSILVPLPPKSDVFPFQDKTWTSSVKESSSGQSVEPFKLHVPDADVQDLHDRLKKTRYSPQLAGETFEYGFPPNELKKVVDYWLHKYDWRAQERIINQFPQFKTNIEGLDIHFVHVKPKDIGKDVQVYPLVLLHGWPGSFYEMYDIIPLLIKPRKSVKQPAVSVVFELIVPSLPGFGFSDPPEKSGLDTADVSRIVNKLMQRLKLPQYFVQGGDWGSSVARNLAIMYPERILGVALEMYMIPMLPTMIKTAVASVVPSLVMNPAESYKLITNHIGAMLSETGYLHMHVTKPDTAGASASNSPAGLAAYILGFFSSNTRPWNKNKPDGGLTEFFSMDHLLNNVMIYWWSNSFGTSVRFYKENCGYLGCGNGAERFRYPVTVPAVLSDFRYEVVGVNPPNDFVKPYFEKLVNISFHENGGHFGAMEQPKSLAEDLWVLLLAVK